ncbi:MAG: hypothetical protein IAE91_07795 [Ignavibacteriaceae bacterium]|nr:hypothetical protein [Ignavibacteriaceae bacterium]
MPLSYDFTKIPIFTGEENNQRQGAKNPLLYQLLQGILGDSAFKMTEFLENKTGAEEKFNSNTDALQKYLTGIISGGNPSLDKQRKMAVSDIRKTTGRGYDTINERLASSGLSKSGTGINILNELFRNEADAISKTDGMIAAQDIASRLNAASNLTGLENSRIAASSQDKNSEQFMYNLLNSITGQNRQYELAREQLNQAKENSDSGNIFETILSLTGGGLLGSIIGGLGGGASDYLKKLIFGK